MVATELSAGKPDDRGWHRTAVPFPASGRACRVHLEASGDGVDATTPVWTVPRVLVPATPPAPGVAKARNLILISLDTLRADHLSGYGYPRPTSPSIDSRLIGAGTTFLDVSTTFPLTNIAHLSMLTGLYPGAQPIGNTVGADSAVQLLAETLRDQAFHTAAFTEDALLAGAFGFWHGFDVFTERPFVGDARGWATFGDGIDFMRRHADGRFFLFLHTYKVHGPYQSAPAYQSLFAHDGAWQRPDMDPHVPDDQRPVVDAYDRAIREADEQVARLLDAIDALGIGDDTLVALVADHGEAFGEHGLTGHGTGGHQEQIHVPFVLRGPGVPAGRRVATPGSLVDVVPTLLDLLGLPVGTQAQGVSLRPLLADGPAPPPRQLFIAWIGGQASGVRQGNVKALHTPAGLTVFDLAADRYEREPLAALPDDFHPDAALAANAAASDSRRRTLSVNTAGKQAAPSVSEDTQRSLKALGYL